MNDFDANQFRGDPSQLGNFASRPRKRRRGRFLKGPVPLDWLAKASRLPGKALHVGIMLWHEAGITRKREVRLKRRLLEQFGVHRRTATRAVNALEASALLESLRKGRGRRRVVRLLVLEHETDR